MKTNNIFGTLAISILLASCGGEVKEETTTEVEAPKEEAAEMCTYSFQDSADVMWIAYKYTEKTGVKGVFEDVSITNTGSGTSISNVLMYATIQINTASSNSGDPTRDPKIKETFFGSLIDGQAIAGEITSVTGDNNFGHLEAIISMNGETHPVLGEYSLKDGALELKFELSVETWSASDALNALNKVCEDLHKGADGKSILWPDVTVYVNTTIAADCK
jgi:hypothetical protein